MRALGARTYQLRTAMSAEFAVLGALAGLLAAIGAGVIGWALARFALHLPYRPGLSLLLTGVGGGIAGVVAAGWWATYGLLRRPVRQDLQGY